MQHRVQFDFEIDFSNGGGIRGRDFRLDIPGEDISDRDLADDLVADMRLLMVRAVRIRNKRIIIEPHKRDPIDAARSAVRQNPHGRCSLVALETAAVWLAMVACCP